MFAKGDLLDCAIGEGQREVRLFVNGRCDGADVGVASKNADQMRLLILSYLGGNPYPNPGGSLFCDAVVL